MNLIVGTGRCGTGYAAELLKQCGFDCRHEKMGGNWLSSWHSASMLLPYGPFKLKDCSETTDIDPVEKVIHLFRDPASVCSSWVACKPKAFEFSRFCLNGHTGLISDWESEAIRMEWAMYHYIHWNRLCERFGGDKVVVFELPEYIDRCFGFRPKKEVSKNVNSYASKPQYRRFGAKEFAAVDRKLWLECSALYNSYL